MLRNLILLLATIIAFGLVFWISGDLTSESAAEGSVIPDHNMESELKANPDLENLKAFSRLYGYVKYFHPSDEARQVDWDKFAAYGAKQVLGIRGRDQLKRVLIKMFRPIAPTLSLFLSEEKAVFDSAVVYPSKMKDLNMISWQHLGYAPGKQKSIYRKVRIGRSDKPIIMKETLKKGDHLKRDIGKGLTCIMPMVLSGDAQSTYPKGSPALLHELNKKIDAFSKIHLNIDDRYLWIGNIINAWNVFQHFYPYFDVVAVDWDKVHLLSLRNILASKTVEGYSQVLDRMVARLEDGHGYVYRGNSSKKGGLPIRVAYIEGGIVITGSLDERFKKGDRIISIDNVDGVEILKRAEQFVSGSPQLRRWRALNQYGSGQLGTVAEIRLLRDNQEIRLKYERLTETRGFFFNRISEFKFPGIRKYEDGVYYINLYNVDAEAYLKILDALADAKGIIFDWRSDGTFNRQKKRLNYTTDLVPHLIKRRVNTANWNIPKIIRPDRENMFFHHSFWSIEPKAPFFKGKILFINVPSCVSYGETIMGIIEHYKLAEFVGMSTAGCNGNVTFINLPGFYRIMFTGMKVLKHDGSQHHLIGIKPQYPVNRTVQAVQSGKDEFLQKALAVIRANK